MGKERREEQLLQGGTLREFSLYDNERILFVRRGTLEHTIFRLKTSSYWRGKGK